MDREIGNEHYRLERLYAASFVDRGAFLLLCVKREFSQYSVSR